MAGMGVWVSAYKLDADVNYSAGSGMVDGVKPLAVVPISIGDEPDLPHAPNAVGVSPIDAAINNLASELGIEPARISISIAA